MRALTPTCSSARCTRHSDARSSPVAPGLSGLGRVDAIVEPQQEPDTVHAQAAAHHAHGRRLQPGAQRIRLANSIQVPIQRNEDVLDDVVDLVLAAEQPERQPRDLGRVLAEQVGEPPLQLRGVDPSSGATPAAEEFPGAAFTAESEQSRRATATGATTATAQIDA